MTLLLSDSRSSTDPATTAPLSQRVVQRAGSWLARDRADRGRRSFLTRAAMVGTALAVNPFDFILRPQSAYASVCGPANECSQGWTAFCCTVNGGANTCPPGSYAAGWWKVTSSAFCRGGDRYIVDCNRSPGSSCSCRCATGTCDRRRVCCNNFRYGQCNTQVAGVTEVVCRVIICTPPWEWGNCTTTVRTDNRTAFHSASCLPGQNPSIIEITYQDMGLVGSELGRPVGEETAGPDGGAWRAYENGAITHVEAHGTAVLIGPAGIRYTELDGPNGPLGYITGEPIEVAGGQVLPAEGGALYTTPDGDAFEVTGPLADAYNAEGGPTEWLGFPRGGVEDAPGGRRRIDFASGWSLVLDPSTEEVRLLPADVQLPDQAGEWPATADVTRWAGDDRVGTAVRVSEESHPDGALVAVVAAAGSFADALSGGVLAAIEGGPVLLTAQDRLSPATAEELARLEVETVYVIGGEEVVSSRVEEDIADAIDDVEVIRLSDDSRFGTAVAVSQVIAPDGADVVYLTSGRQFPDALAASPAASLQGVPLLLAEPTQLPEATAEELARLSPDLVILVGGELALTEAVGIAAGNAAGGADVERIEGDSRFDTAAAVVEETTEGTVDTVLIATGDAFADALAAGAASGISGSPLLLVSTTGTVPPVTRRAIERLQPDSIVIVGGSAAVADQVQRQLAAIPVEDHTSRDVSGEPTSEPTPTSS